MPRYVAALVLPALLICNASPVSATDYPKIPRQSVLRIYTLPGVGAGGFGSQGTGVFITRSGWILTASHALNDNPALVKVAIHGEYLDVLEVFRSSQQDLGLVRIDPRSLPASSPISALDIDSMNPGVGITVFGMGFPRGKYQWQSGFIMRYVDGDKSSGYTTTSFSFDAGASGSPLITLDGRICGILVQGANDFKGRPVVNKWISATRIREVLAEAKSRSQIEIHDPQHVAKVAGPLTQKSAAAIKPLAVERTPPRSAATPVRALHLGESRTSDKGLEQLKNLTNLQELSFEFGRVTDAGLAQLKDLSKLEVLCLNGNPIGAAGLKQLEGLSLLRELRLSGTLLDNGGLASLRHFPLLETLHLGITPIGDSGLDELRSLKKLRILNLSGTRISEAGLKQLTGHPELRQLDLSITRIADGSLEQLQSLSELESLSLRGTLVSDAALTKLGKMLRLRQLDLSQSAVSGASLRELNSLIELRSLNISGCPIGDAELAQLQDNRQLRQLSAVNTKITAAGVADLQRKIPELLIQH